MQQPPKTLSPPQNAQLLQLWNAHCRELVDVKLSREATSSPTKIPPHTYGFVVRLHGFFRDFLQAAILRSCGDEKENANHAPSTAATTTAAVANNPLIQHPRQSSLKAYAQYALASKSSTTGQEQQQQQRQEIRLPAGRRVIALHHEDFLQELNQYEVGSLTVSEEFVRRESFGAFLYHMPRDALLALGCAMALAMVTALAPQQQRNETTVNRFLDSTQIVVRFAHLKPKIQMIDIKTGLLGKLLTIKGHVVKARPKRLQVATADFCCLKCRTNQTHSFEQGRYSIPTTMCQWRMPRPHVCTGPSDRPLPGRAGNSPAGGAGRKHGPGGSHAAPDGSDLDARSRGRVPSGGYRARRRHGGGRKHGRGRGANGQARQGNEHLQTVSAGTFRHDNVREQQPPGWWWIASQQSQQVTYTQQQLGSITQLCHADHRYFGLVERRAFPFDLLVRSICPAIIGHHEVKAGLLLCLLGGTPPSAQSSDRSNAIRCNSHILIVGDPGMGKSQMLLAANQLAARSVYVGGNTSSTTGLTVTLTKEERGESGIEAGALVLADQGICAIDEFDKMAKNHQDGKFTVLWTQLV